MNVPDGPYIVTAKRFATDGQHPLGRRPVSRLAVATLEEARYAAMVAVGSHGNSWDRLKAYGTLSESGGTVGPLPDGTVIEVEQQTPAWLAGELAKREGRLIWPANDLDTLRRQCDAYNAKQKAAA